MASTIKVENITTPDGTGNVVFNRPLQGDGTNLTGTGDDFVGAQHCKAWVCMELRNTMTIHESFNVSSITDVAVGHVQVNYSSPLPSSHYSYAGAAELTNANNAMTAAAYSVSSSFIKMVYEDVDAGFTDYARATVQVFSN